MVSYSFVLKGELNINYLVKALHDVMSDYYASRATVPSSAPLYWVMKMDERE